MNSIKTRIPAENQSRIVMPTYAAFGVSACVDADVPARKHIALFTGATPGTLVWSPPPC